MLIKSESDVTKAWEGRGEWMEVGWEEEDVWVCQINISVDYKQVISKISKPVMKSTYLFIHLLEGGLQIS